VPFQVDVAVREYTVFVGRVAEHDAGAAGGGQSEDDGKNGGSLEVHLGGELLRVFDLESNEAVWEAGVGWEAVDVVESGGEKVLGSKGSLTVILILLLSAISATAMTYEFHSSLLRHRDALEMPG